MRRLKLSITTQNGSSIKIPFDYKYHISVKLMEAIGIDDNHGVRQKYSFSNLTGTKGVGDGIIVKNTSIILSVYDETIIQKIVLYFHKNPKIYNGLIISSIQFLKSETISNDDIIVFKPQSPILLSINNMGKKSFISYKDDIADTMLKKSINNLLHINNMGEHIDKFSVRFLKNTSDAKTKCVTLKGAKLKGSLCPFVFQGPSDVANLIYHIGVGNSVNLGFGFLTI